MWSSSADGQVDMMLGIGACCLPVASFFPSEDKLKVIRYDILGFWGFGVLGMWRFKEKGKDVKGC